MGTNKLLDPITPGEILREDFMEPLNIKVGFFAQQLNSLEAQQPNH